MRVFLRRLRLGQIERAGKIGRAASGSKRSGRERGRLLASSALGGSLDRLLSAGRIDGAQGDASGLNASQVEAIEPLLWPALPIGVRADDPAAAYEEHRLRVLNGAAGVDGSSFRLPDEGAERGEDGDRDRDRDGEGNEHDLRTVRRQTGSPSTDRPGWSDALTGPIAVELVAVEAVAQGAHRDPSDAARRLRLADPGLLTPGLALVAAMLARALGDRPDVAHALVHEAPVVIVRVPEGVSRDQVVAVIEQCLTEWPMRESAAGAGDADGAQAANGAGGGSPGGATGSPDPDVNPAWERAFGDGLDYAGPALEDDDLDDLRGLHPLHGGPAGEGWVRSINVIDATSRSGRSETSRAATGEVSRTIAALQDRRQTVIVHALHDQDLPPEVASLADGEIILTLPDPDAMATVVEAVTGERVDEMPGGLWSRPAAARRASGAGVAVREADDEASADPVAVADPDGGAYAGTNAGEERAAFTVPDVLSSLSPLRGAAASLERLVRLTDASAVRADRGISAASEDAPPLEALAGYGAAREEGLAIAADLRAYRAGTIGWSSVARGMVLAGPPGTGKSLFARALARSAGVPLVIGSIAAWQANRTGHLGDMLAAMRASFEEARRLAPCVLFIDELDSIGDRTRFDERHRDYSVQVVNALLEQLDGAAAREGVVVCGATNDPGRIDPAVLRPGRMEQVVWIGLPELDDLITMLRTHLTGVPIMTADRHEAVGEGVTGTGTTRGTRPLKGGDRTGRGGKDRSGGTPEHEDPKADRGRRDVRSDAAVASGPQGHGAGDYGRPKCHPSGSVAVLSEGTARQGRTVDGARLTDAELRPVALALRGRTGADVAATVRRARAVARRTGRIVSLADLLAATPDRDGRSRPQSMRWRSAVHEAGHAVVFLALDLGIVRSVSIDHDGGTTHVEPAPSDGTRAASEAMLAFLLAGRAAESVLLGEPSSGSGGARTSDLARATRLAAAMHASHGLGDGLIWHGDLEGTDADTDAPPRIPLHLCEAVETELRRAHDRALGIVRDRRETIEALARRVLAEGYVEGTEIAGQG